MKKILYIVAAFIFVVACTNYMMAPSGGRYANRIGRITENRQPNSIVPITREQQMCLEMLEPMTKIRVYLTDPTLNNSTREAIQATLEQYDYKCTRFIEQN